MIIIGELCSWERATTARCSLGSQVVCSGLWTDTVFLRNLRVTIAVRICRSVKSLSLDIGRLNHHFLDSSSHPVLFGLQTVQMGSPYKAVEALYRGEDILSLTRFSFFGEELDYTLDKIRERQCRRGVARLSTVV